jgi:glycosyltransferase involved in cell wall biosynthesis
VKKCIVVSVSNDISTDQRVYKQCHAMMEAGFQIKLIGIERSYSLPVERPYRVKRMKLWFYRTFLFYANLNFRLFFTLLFARAGIFYANDLDTLPANFLASAFRRKPLVYDSHEFFTEVPELDGYPFKKGVWRFLERIIIHHCDRVITVNHSIAELIKSRYDLSEVQVVRNVSQVAFSGRALSRKELAVGENDFLLVLQGTGINIDRGAEELLEALTLLEKVHLMIVGRGDAIPLLEQLVQDWDLQKKVSFKPKMPFEEMMRYTAAADLGISLDKDTNINYRYSLPNKIFDYALAGIPVLASNLPEVVKIVEGFSLGQICPSHKPREIAEAINALRQDPEALQSYRQNARNLIYELNWKAEYAPVIEKLKALGS